MLFTLINVFHINLFVVFHVLGPMDVVSAEAGPPYIRWTLQTLLWQPKRRWSGATPKYGWWYPWCPNWVRWSPNTSENRIQRSRSRCVIWKNPWDDQAWVRMSPFPGTCQWWRRTIFEWTTLYSAFSVEKRFDTWSLETIAVNSNIFKRHRNS